MPVLRSRRERKNACSGPPRVATISSRRGHSRVGALSSAASSAGLPNAGTGCPLTLISGRRSSMRPGCTITGSLPVTGSGIAARAASREYGGSGAAAAAAPTMVVAWVAAGATVALEAEVAAEAALPAVASLSAAAVAVAKGHLPAASPTAGCAKV